jgi:hypothetical protein
MKCKLIYEWILFIQLRKNLKKNMHASWTKCTHLDKLFPTVDVPSLHSDQEIHYIKLLEIVRIWFFKFHFVDYIFFGVQVPKSNNSSQVYYHCAIDSCGPLLILFFVFFVTAVNNCEASCTVAQLYYCRRFTCLTVQLCE